MHEFLQFFCPRSLSLHRGWALKNIWAIVLYWVCCYFFVMQPFNIMCVLASVSLILRLLHTLTWTPRIPNMRKNVQHIKTMFPIGFRDISSDWTTSFKPGALWITLSGFKTLKSLKSLNIPNILFWFPTKGEADEDEID